MVVEGERLGDATYFAGEEGRLTQRGAKMATSTSVANQVRVRPRQNFPRIARKRQLARFYMVVIGTYIATDNVSIYTVVHLATLSIWSGVGRTMRRVCGNLVGTKQHNLRADLATNGNS